MTRGFAILLSITLLVVAAFALAVTQRGTSEENETARGESFFPRLAGDLSDVTTVKVQRASGTFRLTRDTRGWRNEGAGGYRATASRIEETLQTLVGLARVTPRTSRPRLHARLGVEEVGPDANSTRLSLLNDNSEVLADVIVGQSQQATAGRPRAGVYVRLPGEARAWLAHGSLDVHYDAPDWSERALVDIAADDVLMMSFRHPGAQRFEIRRAGPGSEGLTLAGLPEDTPIKHRFQLQYLAGLFAELSMENAREAAESTTENAAGVEVIVMSREAMLVRLYAAPADADGETWATLEVAVPAGGRPSNRVLRTVESLRERVKGWAFLLPQRAAERLEVRLPDILGRPAS